MNWSAARAVLKAFVMASVPLKKVTDKCILVSYGGNNLWFPRSAYQYRSIFLGNPPGIDCNKRRNKAC